MKGEARLQNKANWPGKAAAGFTLVELVVVVGLLCIVATLVVQTVGRAQSDAEQTVARTTLHGIRDAFCGTAGSPGLLCDMACVPGFSNGALRVGSLLEAPTNYPAFTNYDRLARRGWRGPYVQNAQGAMNTNELLQGRYPAPHDRRSATDQTFLERGFYAGEYGTTNDLVLADPWGNPIVLQFPTNALDDDELLGYARLVSAGPNGVLDTPRDKLGGRREDQPGTDSNRVDDLVLFLKRADVYEP